MERNGRRGYRLSGQVSFGRLILAEVLREEGVNNSPLVVAPTGHADDPNPLHLIFEGLAA